MHFKIIKIKNGKKYKKKLNCTLNFFKKTKKKTYFVVKFRSLVF